MLGVDHHFIKYQAGEEWSYPFFSRIWYDVIPPSYHFILVSWFSDAHYHSLAELSVFSAGGGNESVGLEVLLDVDFTFFLIQDEIGDLHRELQTRYQSIIVSRAKDAIKNEAIFVTLTEYFQKRRDVEARFREVVQKRWQENPSLHCTLDQFHLGRVQISESVATKQLLTRVQIERNEKEAFLQQAQLEREKTAVEVNAINLERDKILRTAQAEASLVRANARAESERIKSRAEINGTRLLLLLSDITTQDHKTAFTYIRTLRNRGSSVSIDVSYLSADNVLRTQAVT